MPFPGTPTLPGILTLPGTASHSPLSVRRPPPRNNPSRRPLVHKRVPPSRSRCACVSTSKVRFISMVLAFRTTCDRRPFLPPCEIYFTFRARLVSSPFGPSLGGNRGTIRKSGRRWNTLQHPVISTFFFISLPYERSVSGPPSARRKRVRKTNASLAPFLLSSYGSKRNRHGCVCNLQRPGTT